MTEFKVRFYDSIGRKFFDTPFKSLNDAHIYFKELKFNPFVSKVELLQVKTTTILEHPE